MIRTRKRTLCVHFYLVFDQCPPPREERNNRRTETSRRLKRINFVFPSLDRLDLTNFRAYRFFVIVRTKTNKQFKRAIGNAYEYRCSANRPHRLLIRGQNMRLFLIFFIYIDISYKQWGLIISVIEFIMKG